MAPLALFSQEKPLEKPNLDAAKSKMVLRSNTRDKALLMKDNQHMKMVTIRKHNTVINQQRMMQQRMQRVNRQQIQKQRMLQQRKLRQQAMRRRQIVRRKLN